MMGIEVEFQTALYTAMQADAPLQAAVVGVYDVAPQNADGGDLTAFPYVTIGTVIMTEDDTGTKNGFSALARIHTWSHTGSMRECKVIQGLLYDVLHKQELTITGFNNYSLLRETTDITRETDGEFHGVCEYRALIESA